MTRTGKKRVTKKKEIPFGSKVERFAYLGFHPKRETRPGTYKYVNIFPGCHDWNKPQKIVSKISSWSRSLELEEFSRRLAYHGDHIVRRREWEKSVNGPGWHYVPAISSVREITFLKEERFPESKSKTSVPGPGTYGKNHVPFTLKEEKSREKGYSFSTVVPFAVAAGRPESLDPQPAYHLPPNLYNLKSCTNELITKIVSRRGPYDLFTGPRFQRFIIPKGLDRRQIPPIKVDSSAWNHPKNAFKGKFMRCGKDSFVTTRMVLKNPFTLSFLSNPGPSDYDPYPPVIIGPTNFPFNSSMNVTSHALRELLPPPGRYNLDRKKRIIGDGLKSAFNSKTPRGLPQVPKWSWFK